jgi:CRISPR/Cas system-associated exonuclease Cas4 (RecB family)
MSPDLFRYQNSVIIAPRELFDDYLALKKREPSLNLHLYTLEEVEAAFTYQSDERALIYLLKQGYPYSEAKDILREIAFVENKPYQNPKLQKLLALQKELLAEGLLYKLPNPERLFEKKNILVAGYHCGRRISNYLGELHNMAMGFDVGEEAAAIPPLSSFKNVYEELAYLYNRIAEDLHNGVSIDSIYVYGLDPLYEDLIHEYNRHYGFQIEEVNDSRLFDSVLYHDFALSFLEKGLDASLAELEKGNAENPDYATLYRFSKRFAGIFTDPKQQLALYDEIAKATPASPRHYQQVVRRLTEPFAPRGSHIYLVNFTMGVFPSSAAEDPYLFDEGVAELGRATSQEISLERALELNRLLTSGHLSAITFKEKGFGSVYFPSGIVKEKGMSVLVSPRLPYDYSTEKQRYLTLSLLDQKTNFLYRDPRLEALLSQTDVKAYRSYDFAYTPFKPFKEEKERSYSPTALHKFFGCPYSYYLERVLGLKDTALSFPMRLGYLFHALLSDYYKKPSFDFASEWKSLLAEEASKNGAWTPKEEALFIRLKDEAEEMIAFYQHHDSFLKNLSVTSEEHFQLPLAERPLVSLEGQYDKIVCFGDLAPAFVVVDYKTGGERFNKNLVPYKLSLQLPFYAYYALQVEPYKTRSLVGLFIGPLLSSGLYRKKEDESNEKFNNDKFKLEGLFTSDADLLSSFDPSFRSSRESDLIRACHYSEKSGFYTYAADRAKSAEDFASLALAAKNAVLEADSRIFAGDFSIQPLVYKSEFDACAYCPYRDVCYRDDTAVNYQPSSPEDEEASDADDDDGETSEEEEGDEDAE